MLGDWRDYLSFEASAGTEEEQNRQKMSTNPLAK